jgi:hypothetical protein
VGYRWVEEMFSFGCGAVGVDDILSFRVFRVGEDFRRQGEVIEVAIKVCHLIRRVKI